MTHHSTSIPPGAWLGLLGGGQLGRMFCMAAQSLGYKVAVLDPGTRGPAGTIADKMVQADYLDELWLEELANLCGAITTEFENVPAESLKYLSARRPVSPEAESVAIAQDRIAEKGFIRSLGLEVAPHVVLMDVAQIQSMDLTDYLPGILKVSRLGYDGKGQARVTTLEDVTQAFRQLGNVPCVLEKMLPLNKEVSVVVVRDRSGTTAYYSIAENIHRNGILDVSIVPARISNDIAELARSAAIRIAEGLHYIGVLCVEFFMLDNGQLLVNEIAPRPHNSGHYTIDACYTSQFEQQTRVLANLPLGDCSQFSPAVMLNLLGDLWFVNGDGVTPKEPDWAIVLRNPRAKLHLYGKDDPRLGRKMGHVTILAPTLEQAIKEASDMRNALQTPLAR
jgi:5-(carboxyamino)imidazole ribonucleotide synthase